MIGTPEMMASNGSSIAIFTATISETLCQPENSAVVFALPIRNVTTSAITKELVILKRRRYPLHVHQSTVEYADSFLPGIFQTLLPEIIVPQLAD